MAALALAMLLTGAGPIGETEQQRRPAPPPPPMMPVPMVRMAPSVPPPPPPHTGPAPPLRARAHLNTYFSADDYPAAALRGNDEGAVAFRLTIGPNGRVTDCSITTSSGSSALDQATCRILRSRARYTPARDADGNPTSGTDSGRLTWLLPGWPRSLPRPAVRAALRGDYESLVSARDYPAAALASRASGETYVRVVVGPNGRVIACDIDIDGSSGSIALDAAACRIMRARARFTPARSAAGAAVCGVEFGPIRWQPPPPDRRPPRIRAGPPPVAPPPVEQQLAPNACPGRAP